MSSRSGRIYSVKGDYRRTLVRWGTATSLLFILWMPVAQADIEIRLPGETNGVDVLLGFGASHDETAYEGEADLQEPGVLVALMTKNFYIDVHKFVYEHRINDTVKARLFGVTDSLPNPEDIPSEMNIKSGESFDLGLGLYKSFDDYYLAAKIAADVTGEHSGYFTEVISGLSKVSGKNKLTIEMAGRYQNRKRSQYYYGVSTGEATDKLPVFSADAELSASFEVNYIYSLTKQLGLLAAANATAISDTARDSPRIDSEADLAEFEAGVYLVWQFPLYHL